MLYIIEKQRDQPPYKWITKEENKPEGDEASGWSA